MSQVPSPAAQPVPSMQPATVVVLLALLLGIQPVATDLYLPSLPALTQDLGAPPAQAQRTLTVLLLAMGISQLFWGPLSDRFGRRPVLLPGLLIYAVTALGAALAPSMDLLLMWRTLQGIALGASVACARAVVRDLYTPVQGARVMSQALSGLGMLACAAPALGGWLAETFHWRIALTVPALVGALTLWLVLSRFTETVAARDTQALAPGRLWNTWRTILRHPSFHAWSALAAASYGGLFVYLAISSFVFVGVLGLTRTQHGLIMFAASLFYVAGTFLCRRLLARLGIRGAVAVAGGLSLFSGGALGLLGEFAPLHAGNGWSWLLLALPLCIFTLAHGVHQPCSQSGAVGPFPRAAGAAAALNGFITTALAWFSGRWLGARMDDTLHAFTQGMAFWGLVIAAVCWTLVRRNGEPVDPAR